MTTPLSSSAFGRKSMRITTRIMTRHCLAGPESSVSESTSGSGHDLKMPGPWPGEVYPTCSGPWKGPMTFLPQCPKATAIGGSKKGFRTAGCAPQSEFQAAPPQHLHIVPAWPLRAEGQHPAPLSPPLSGCPRGVLTPSQLHTLGAMPISP